MTDVLAGKGNGCHPNQTWRRGRSSDRRRSRSHKVTINAAHNHGSRRGSPRICRRPRPRACNHRCTRNRGDGSPRRTGRTNHEKGRSWCQSAVTAPTAPTTPLKRFRARLTGPRGRERAAVRFAVRVRGRCPGDDRVSTRSSQDRRARLRSADARLPRSPRGHHASLRTERCTSPRPSLGSKLGWARVVLGPPPPIPPPLAACGAPPSFDGGALRP